MAVAIDRCFLPLQRNQHGNAFLSNSTQLLIGKSQLEGNTAHVVDLPRPFLPLSLVPQGEAASLPRQLPALLGLPSLPSAPPIANVADADIGTPDSWIPRDPRLVRLTGKHPFNAEPNLRDLYAQGFFTPTSLFFVRNHGAVPQIDQKRAEDWRLNVHGLCENPAMLSLNDLRTKFRVVTIPVTLSCAGNRRKEQNIVQKSLGFSWGPGGVSTALFTGVYLADVLAYVKPTRGAKHVVFEGSDELPNGPYGTSQRLGWARDKRKGMLLAWAMNGTPLEPDHGYPLRLVVPSQIGGRSVKWLARIELSAKESQHHLHFYDNKVLPTTLGPNQAREEKKWWYDPRYIIRDLNANSAIACPDHDEVLDTSSASEIDTYTVKGYAYGGGGRRITRVEISLDDGQTWALADITYPEDLFRDVTHFDPVYGDLELGDEDSCFCWSFWSLDVAISTLKASRAISVRSMDESMAVQPRNMYWNPTGMMNNWWFRVCIHHIGDEKLRFEHPTMAGTQPGGWMQRLKDAGLDPSRPDFSSNPSSLPSSSPPTIIKPAILMIKPDVKRKITRAELKSEEATLKAWFVVKGEVYDGSGFFDDHPGGAESIRLAAGEDATEDFMAIHSDDAKRRLAEFHVGTLTGEAESDTNEGHQTEAYLNAKKWKKLVLSRATQASRDSKILSFAIPETKSELGLEIGQHVYLRVRRKAGNFIQRAYTPLGHENSKGVIDFLIKIYYPTPAFPEGGRMTTELDRIVPGDELEVKGPLGHFVWKGRGDALFHQKPIKVREFGMICAGSGITPILPIVRSILNDPLDETKVFMLDFNRVEEDILCREDLDRLAAEHGSRFKLNYSLTGRPTPTGWSDLVGRLTDDMLQSHFPAPGPERLICLCGTPQMEQGAKESLTRLGWNLLEQVVLF